MSTQPSVRRAAAYFLAPEAIPGARATTAQCPTLAGFAAAQGWRYVAEFTDRAGQDELGFADRPGMVALFAAIARGEVDVVIVDTAAALPAQPVQRALVLHELQRAGIELLAADRGDDLTRVPGDAEVQRVRAVLAVAADFASHPEVAALRQARHKLSGIDAARAEILRLRAGGTSLTTVARRLNALGLTDEQGAQWTRMSVFAIARTLPQPDARESGEP